VAWQLYGMRMLRFMKVQVVFGAKNAFAYLGFSVTWFKRTLIAEKSNTVCQKTARGIVNSFVACRNVAPAERT